MKCFPFLIITVALLNCQHKGVDWHKPLHAMTLVGRSAAKFCAYFGETALMSVASCQMVCCVMLHVVLTVCEVGVSGGPEVCSSPGSSSPSLLAANHPVHRLAGILVYNQQYDRLLYSYVSLTTESLPLHKYLCHSTANHSAELDWR